MFKEITSYGEPFVKDGKLIASNEGSRTRLQRCWVGSVQLEVIEPGDAVKEVNRDIFEKAGPGIAHIAYSISQEHYEEEVAKMTATGLDIVLKGTIKQGRGFTYFDARDRGGLLIELMSNPKKS